MTTGAGAPVPDEPREPAPALRPAWRVALRAGALSTAVLVGFGAAVGLATGELQRNPHWAGRYYGPAVLPFIVIITVAAYVIQRSRIRNR